MSHLLRDRDEIVQWLIEHKINNYVIVPDEEYGFVVDCHGNVDLYKHDLDFIAVKFREVVKTFNCGYNNLQSLKGCPDFIHGSFNCSGNKLTSLEFCPQEVGGDFSCNYNDIESLEHIPNKMEWGFYAEDNPQLGEWQTIDDFKLVKKEHLRIKTILALKEKLEESIKTDSSNSKQIKL